MTDTSFQDRLARLNASQPAEAPQVEVPTAQTRADRLVLALAHLERGGISGDFAYSKAFRGMAKMGIILPPLHYWSWLGLMIFGFVILTVACWFLIFVCTQLGHFPRPVRGMINAGPEGMFVFNTVLGILFAAFHKVKARSIGLPRWSDL